MRPHHPTSPRHGTTNERKRKRSKTIDWANVEPYDIARSERALWVAVITQAMMDALSNSSNPEHMAHRRSAIQWLLEGREDFHFVCMMADMDAATVRRKAKRALFSPTHWRAPAGSGSRYVERRLYAARRKRECELKAEKASGQSAAVYQLHVKGKLR